VSCAQPCRLLSSHPIQNLSCGKDRKINDVTEDADVNSHFLVKISTVVYQKVFAQVRESKGQKLPLCLLLIEMLAVQPKSCAALADAQSNSSPARCNATVTTRRSIPEKSSQAKLPYQVKKTVVWSKDFSEQGI